MLLRNHIYQWETVSSEELKPDDYFNLNGAFGAIKFNPRLDMVIKKSNGIDIYRKEDGGFVLYQMDNASIIRPFSTILLYNKKNGIVRPLVGINAPIYSTNDDTELFEGMDFHSADPAVRERNLEAVRKYTRFFFDHTTGKHGLFYICENYEEIREAINIFYRDPKNVTSLKEQREKIAKLRSGNKMTTFRTVLEKHLATPSRNGKFRMRFLDKWDAKYICSVKALIVFKNALFQVHINIKSESSKVLELSNEVQGFRAGTFFSEEAASQLGQLGYDEELPPFDEI